MAKRGQAWTANRARDTAPSERERTRVVILILGMDRVRLIGRVQVVDVLLFTQKKGSSMSERTHRKRKTTCCGDERGRHYFSDEISLRLKATRVMGRILFSSTKECTADIVWEERHIIPLVTFPSLSRWLPELSDFSLFQVFKVNDKVTYLDEVVKKSASEPNFRLYKLISPLMRPEHLSFRWEWFRSSFFCVHGCYIGDYHSLRRALDPFMSPPRWLYSIPYSSWKRMSMNKCIEEVKRLSCPEWFFEKDGLHLNSPSAYALLGWRVGPVSKAHWPCVIRRDFKEDTILRTLFRELSLDILSCERYDLRLLSTNWVDFTKTRQVASEILKNPLLREPPRHDCIKESYNELTLPVNIITMRQSAPEAFIKMSDHIRRAITTNDEKEVYSVLYLEARFGVTPLSRCLTLLPQIPAVT